MHLNKKYYTLNQCDPVEGMEGEEASLCLKSHSDCSVLPNSKDCPQTLHHYT